MENCKNYDKCFKLQENKGNVSGEWRDVPKREECKCWDWFFTNILENHDIGDFKRFLMCSHPIEVNKNANESISPDT